MPFMNCNTAILRPFLNKFHSMCVTLPVRSNKPPSRSIDLFNDWGLNKNLYIHKQTANLPSSIETSNNCGNTYQQHERSIALILDAISRVAPIPDFSLRQTNSMEMSVVTTDDRRCCRGCSSFNQDNRTLAGRRRQAGRLLCRAIRRSPNVRVNSKESGSERQRYCRSPNQILVFVYYSAANGVKVLMCTNLIKRSNIV